MVNMVAPIMVPKFKFLVKVQFHFYPLIVPIQYLL